ncbi:hypothetical protein EYZ11_009235 [Aspergillus tanneri]|uniref:Uncharacterized protein n=1 Tax=Aspergillus tanneri TaxID=1220188 RepID=A0A4S3JDW6_9EURO|nr:uncharacterized protein ATNIH1004_005951 [Aspergillus tanneri]KAA8647261.1 hypothetical protein ATNIH1004_005951 [Aspergillus tanneri]THC91311.1 hypothetical protein EYZ11_009235 [Aspergillus tanneri]
MGLCGIALLSVAMALFGLFQPIALTGLGTYRLPERMELMTDHLRELLDAVSISVTNGTLKTKRWPALSTQNVALLTAGEVIPSEPNQIPLETDRPSCVSEEGQSSFTEFDILSSTPYHQLGQLFHSYDIENILPLHNVTFPLSSVWIWPTLFFIGLFAFRMFTGAARQERYRQLAEAEIIDFITAIQARKALILERMNLTASETDAQIDKVFAQLTTDLAQLRAQLLTSLSCDADLLRERFQERARSGFERYFSPEQIVEFRLEMRNSDQVIGDGQSRGEPSRNEDQCLGCRGGAATNEASVGNGLIDWPDVSLSSKNGHINSFKAKEEMKDLPQDNAETEAPSPETPEWAKEAQRIEDEKAKLAWWAMASGGKTRTIDDIEKERKIRQESAGEVNRYV